MACKLILRGITEVKRWKFPRAQELWTIIISYIIIGIMCMEQEEDTTNQPKKGTSIIDHINQQINGVAGWMDAKWGGPTRIKRTEWGKTSKVMAQANS